MRQAFVALGALVILAYAILGMLLMNIWEVTVASGYPLDETIQAMQAAGQPYSAVPGIIFAVVGGILALVWAVGSFSTRIMQPWFALSAWAAVIACGAPAYFFASFRNLNSVGDTFYTWNSGAAFALVVPLYAASAVAALVAIVSLVVGVVRCRSAQFSDDRA